MRQHLKFKAFLYPTSFRIDQEQYKSLQQISQSVQGKIAPLVRTAVDFYLIWRRSTENISIDLTDDISESELWDEFWDDFWKAGKQKKPNYRLVKLDVYEDQYESLKKICFERGSNLGSLFRTSVDLFLMWHREVSKYN